MNVWRIPWVKIVVVLALLGWWVGTPYYVVTPEKGGYVADPRTMEVSCHYRGLQGERIIVTQDCYGFRLLRWDSKPCIPQHAEWPSNVPFQICKAS